MRQPSLHATLLLLIVLAVLLRAGVALYLGDGVPEEKDEFSYSMLATRLTTGHGYSFDRGWYPFTLPAAPTSHWSFLYAAFVAAAYLVVGFHPLAARLLGALLTGTLLPILMYRLTRRVLPLAAPTQTERETWLSEPVPLLAAALSAVYAYFALYGAMVQTEGLYILAVLWSLERALAVAESWRIHEGRDHHCIAALTFGLSLGIATLLRQSFLPWVLVLFAYLMVRSFYPKLHWEARSEPTGPRYSFTRARNSWSALLIAGAVLVACILPFTIRNYRVYGEFLLLNSNAGYAMYSAQHPLHGTEFQPYLAAPLPADLVDKGLNEAQWDRALIQRGIGFVLADPVRYLRLSLSRAADYFIFWPTADSSPLFNAGRLLSWGLFLPFMLYGIVLAVRNAAQGKGFRAGFRSFILHPSSLLLLFAVFYTLMHLLTWSMQRYRLPVDAVLLIFAALALHDLAARLFPSLTSAPGQSDRATQATSLETGHPRP